MSEFLGDIPIVVQNDSGDDIPPFSIVVVTSVEFASPEGDQESTTIHHVEQYTGQSGNIFVTGSTVIPAASDDGSDFPGSRSLGMAFSDQLLFVAIDSGPYVSMPLVGEQWGPVPNAWTISRGGMGFFCQGYADAGDSYKRAIFRRDRGWCWGKLTASLSAGSAASPVTATFDTWHYDPTSMATIPPLVKVSATGLQGLSAGNWDASLSGNVGYLVKVEQSQGVNSFYWAGCKVS